ncbi:MAG: hypothetical protein JXR83_08990, partial [Deltaproteobacteria bacterium]|nr:hypothetical protein [Deltaproteobacteria bacterium]
DHTLWCWGDNEHGQLGIGPQSNMYVPTLVAGASWTSVAAGMNHTCAAKTDHTLWCWGDNALGQLGNGTYADSPVPVLVSTN